MSPFATELLAGLASRPRAIAPKWFYDQAGSQLFERICELPEYYPTRVELALLDRHACEIARHIGPEVELVEFGAGAARKVRLLLSALDRPSRFVPVDLSGEYLLDAVSTLQAERPGLEVWPVIADFTRAVELPLPLGQRVGFFPGSSIGNFEPAQAIELLQRFAEMLSGGWLIVGVDLVKEPQILHAAYNDRAGVTAAFNLNLWARANRESGADFALANWSHSAFYNAPQRRIEMHLVSRCAQRVSVAGQGFDFAEGDSVHTENSYKYSVPEFQGLASAAGWEPRFAWTDRERWFSIHLLQHSESSGSLAPGLRG
jgi:dimethylhistidine N-methyltransferase